MTFVPILASPPSNFSVRDHAQVLNCFAKGLVLLAGLLILGAWPSPAAVEERALVARSSAQAASDDGASERADHARARTPRPAPASRNIRPVTRLASGEIRQPASVIAWSGGL